MDKFLDFLAHLKDLLSLDYRALFILSSIGWVIVLMPKTAIEKFALLDLWSQIHSWVFVATIIFTCWLLFAMVFDVGNNLAGRLGSWKKFTQQNYSREKILLNTSKVEKEILAQYVTEDSTTLGFDMRDGIVNGLIAKGLLYRASQASNPMSYDFDTNIQDWVWEYLKKHPEILRDIKPPKNKRHHIW